MVEGHAPGTDEHATLVAPRVPGEGDTVPEDPPEPAGDTEPDAAVDADDGGASPGERRLVRWAVGLALVPLVAAALALVFQVEGAHIPTSDHALMEMGVRDVGHHEAFYGLYSRADWSHPGPMFSYMAAPVYRLLGEWSFSLNLVAVLINGAALVGMALIARRLGGTPALLSTLLAGSLLLRTLGPEFVRDPWNCFVTVLPYGLLIFLTWAMACREIWALPVAVVVTTFLAQTHVGFAVLALPLLALGAAALAVGVVRGGEAGARRRLLRAVVVSIGAGVVLWLPPVVDMFVNRPGNLVRVARYFRHGGETHTVTQAWGVIMGQFGVPPEWLVDALGQNWLGEDSHMYTRPLPLLLVPVVLAAAVLWRRAAAAGRWLVVMLGVTLILGLVAVARTTGPAFYYRLRWAWIAPAIAFVVVAWAAWLLVARRWPGRGTRWLTRGALAALAVLAGVNAFTALTAETRADADAEVVSALLPGVLDEIAGREGVVLVDDAYSSGAWYARGIVLQLERRGIEVRVPADRSQQYGQHRVLRDGETVAAHLIVSQDELAEQFRDDPALRTVALWTSITPEELAAARREADDYDADFPAGTPMDRLYDEDLATYYEVAVFTAAD